MTLLPLSRGRLLLPTCYNKGPLPGKRHQGQGKIASLKWQCSSDQHSSSWQQWLHSSPRLLLEILNSLPTSPESEAKPSDRQGRCLGGSVAGIRTQLIWASKPLTPSLSKCPPKRQLLGLTRNILLQEKKKKRGSMNSLKRNGGTRHSFCSLSHQPKNLICHTLKLCIRTSYKTSG